MTARVPAHRSPAAAGKWSAIVVFQVCAGLIGGAGRKFVVIDTFPTGHIVLLPMPPAVCVREMQLQVYGPDLYFTAPLMPTLMVSMPRRPRVICELLAIAKR
jgi:hypothetical protein